MSPEHKEIQIHNYWACRAVLADSAARPTLRDHAIALLKAQVGNPDFIKLGNLAKKTLTNYGIKITVIPFYKGAGRA